MALGWFIGVPSMQNLFDLDDFNRLQSSFVLLMILRMFKGILLTLKGGRLNYLVQESVMHTQRNEQARFKDAS